MMRNTRSVVFSLLFFLVSVSCFSQKENWPGTLLWKIERSDLTKPSFLFGTMHLQDKRLFNLGDSFYYHFEKAEGFAIEVDFREYMDSLLNRTFTRLEEDQMKDETKTTIKDEIKEVKIDTSANGTIDIPAESKSNKLFRKYFKKIRNERIKRLLVHGEMPTILDAYLYGMAMKQGKWLGAVEDIKDQLNLKDELGKDLDDDDMNLPEEKVMFTLDNMIKIYLAQDLNKIEEYAINSGKPRTKTLLFNNRNAKMVRSIDSLSRDRSMFYAVGAAHLPGDSGVIKLLRQEGYTVTPVYSKTTKPAEKYAETLPALAWYQIGQPDSLYTIDMPGIPSEHNMFGDLVKMKVLVDITNMNFFMVGHTISQFEDDKMTDALKSMGTSMGGGKVENIKRVDRNGLKGVEGTVSGRGFHFKVQILSNNNTAFFLLVGSEKKQAISTGDYNKFFNSFKTNLASQSAKPKEWVQFGLPEKAFTVSMPGKPKRNKIFEKQAENTGWNFAVYDYTDLTTGLYYLMQVRDIEAGHFLDGDSVYFSSFSEILKEDGAEKVNEEYIKFNGFPALRLDMISEKDALFYKTKSIIRGNRVYCMMVLGNTSKKVLEGPDTFFNSFQFSDYKAPESRLYNADNLTFSTMAPNKIVLGKVDEEEKDSTSVYYTCYNENEAISYEILKNHLSKYYWAKNDSSFFKQKADAYVGYQDSLLSYTGVKNGNLNGIEQVIQMPASNNLKKVRLLLHADTLYTLITYVPTQYLNDKTHRDFFEKFTVRNDKAATTVYNSKAVRILTAVKGTDSLAFEEAKNFLGDAFFTKKDLPLLHESLLNSYADDTLLYGSVTNKLIDIMDEIADSSTVDFIRTNYDKINSGKGDTKAALLNVLANYQSSYSYALLKDLLVKQTPANMVTRKSIGYSVNDSLQLTEQLFPEILTLLKNQDFWVDVCDYASELLDSNMLRSEILKPFEKDILHNADTLLNGTLINEEDAWMWNYQSLVNLLGYLNTDESNKMAQKYAAANDLYLKKSAIISLLRNNQVADAKEIEKLAADKELRIDFYHSLKKIGRNSFFTPKYRTQKYFAEAELFSYGQDDYSPSAMEYIGEREILFGGEKKRVFLFKVVFTYDEEDKKNKESYLGIAGPYSLDSKDLETNNDATDIYYDEEYDKKEMENQYKALLKKAEEFLKNKSK